MKRVEAKLFSDGSREAFNVFAVPDAEADIAEANAERSEETKAAAVLLIAAARFYRTGDRA